MIKIFYDVMNDICVVYKDDKDDKDDKDVLKCRSYEYAKCILDYQTFE